MRPLLVGETNTTAMAAPEMALYPYPSTGSGGRFCKIAGLTASEYLVVFDRVNLCRGEWSAREAESKAYEIKMLWRHTLVVLLGRKVCEAFGLPYEPFRSIGRYLVLPHPSGRCRTWNDPENIDRARRALRKAMENK